MLLLCNCLTTFYQIIDRIDKLQQNCQIFIVFRSKGDNNGRILHCKTPGNTNMER